MTEQISIYINGTLRSTTTNFDSFDSFPDSDQGDGRITMGQNSSDIDIGVNHIALFNKQLLASDLVFLNTNS